MEITNTQLMMLIGLTIVDCLLTVFLLILASASKGKKIVKHHQLGEDFYCIEDREHLNKKNETEKDLYPQEDDDEYTLEDVIKESKKNKHKIAFIGKSPGKRKPIKNKKKGNKK
jgi:hypothetical protein